MRLARRGRRHLILRTRAVVDVGAFFSLLATGVVLTHTTTRSIQNLQGPLR